MNQDIVIAVIGGGASGVLAALHLLALERPVTVHLFNGRYDLGGGVAYSISGDDLLLNVAASCMSAWPERPNDFHDWLDDRHPGHYLGTSFVPRRIYREYLQSGLLQAERNSAPGRLRLHAKWVNQILPKKSGFLVQANEAPDVLADAVVLAMGNCLSDPVRPKGPGALNDARYIANPWHYLSQPHPCDPSKDILILGSGLTSVDVILRLHGQDYRGKIHLLSRRGQWPAAHSEYHRLERFKIPPLIGLSPWRLLGRIRKIIREVIAQGGDWRQVIDDLRPETNGLWLNWNLVERSRFLRHVRPYWDRHRHRMAPEIARRLNQKIAAGSVELHAARLVSITAERAGLRVTYRRRGETQTESVTVGQVINCTGPEVRHSSDCQSLVEKLVELDLAKLDSFFPGLATDENGELLDLAGRPIPNLFTIGPVRRGTLWETTAVPEIRTQAAQLARDLVARLCDRDESRAHSLLVHETR